MPIPWRIEQNGAHEWCVRRGASERHFAQTPEDAVRLMRALEAEDAS